MQRKSEAFQLKNWFEKNQRALPWRKNQDPYRIWISEVMLQQTTTQAVIPYYERFLKRFPTLNSLATAPVEDVLEYWAGLGYYSRARNLHKAAIALNKNGFPRSAAELIQYSGFGPYTSRAVSSIAFNEAVGVLDGNVIRVLCRLFGLDINWWETKPREQLQKISDEFSQSGQEARIINQALMEVGATICTPQKPLCLLCPLSSKCVARKTDSVMSLPRPKPKRKSEIWLWTPEVKVKGTEVGLKENDYLPFLKKSWIFPGTAKKLKVKPKEFDLKHGITHHEIYVVLNRTKANSSKGLRWVPITDLKKVNPSSVLQKILVSLR